MMKKREEVVDLLGGTQTVVVRQDPRHHRPTLRRPRCRLAQPTQMRHGKRKDLGPVEWDEAAVEDVRLDPQPMLTVMATHLPMLAAEGQPQEHHHRHLRRPPQVVALVDANSRLPPVQHDNNQCHAPHRQPRH